jgi:hypothetical protein
MRWTVGIGAYLVLIGVLAHTWQPLLIGAVVLATCARVLSRPGSARARWRTGRGIGRGGIPAWRRGGRSCIRRAGARCEPRACRTSATPARLSHERERPTCGLRRRFLWLVLVACVPCRHSVSIPAHAAYPASLPALRSGRPRAPTNFKPRNSPPAAARVPALTPSLRRHGEAQKRAGTACPRKRPPSAGREGAEQLTDDGGAN